MAALIAQLIAQAHAVARQVGLEFTFQHAAYAGRDAYGHAVYAGTTTSIQGVWDDRQRLRQTGTGDLQLVTGEVVYAGDVVIGVLDRLTLPDGRQPPILAIEPVRLATGVVGRRVLFG